MVFFWFYMLAKTQKKPSKEGNKQYAGKEE
jgi:hypothetical protein